MTIAASLEAVGPCATALPPGAQAGARPATWPARIGWITPGEFRFSTAPEAALSPGQAVCVHLAGGPACGAVIVRLKAGAGFARFDTPLDRRTIATAFRQSRRTGRGSPAAAGWPARTRATLLAAGLLTGWSALVAMVRLQLL